MHGDCKAKITEELENFVKDFGCYTQYIITSNFLLLVILYLFL